jgi:hypothetical protein
MVDKKEQREKWREYYRKNKEKYKKYRKKKSVV